MGRPGVVTTPPADALAMFSTDDPTTLFSGLEEIGHGNFGAVYQVFFYSVQTNACPSTVCIGKGERHRFSADTIVIPRL